jgi:hypothetical protein
MTECTLLSDRMPEVALGRSEWTSEENRHLAACESCLAEWRLVQAASRLGEGHLPEIDASRLSRAVWIRVRAAHTQAGRRRVRSVAGLAAAAAIAGLIWAGSVTHRKPAEPIASSAARLRMPLPELDSLQPSELNSVLQTIDESGAESSTADSPELGELDNEEFETVLDYWEG